MKIDLYLISPHEEYARYHACRKHWAYQWRARRGSPYDGAQSRIKLREESFGGLLMGTDGKLYKLDDEAYFYISLLIRS